MNPVVKISRPVLEAALQDLERPHPFAAERLGFISFRQVIGKEDLQLLCFEYHSIPDDEYIEDDTCGARIGGGAIQAAMGRSFRSGSGQMWVHTHGRKGKPLPSPTDLCNGPQVIQSCANAQPKSLQAWAVISEDGIAGQVRDLSGQLHQLSHLAVVGYPMVIPARPPLRPRKKSEDRYDRQNFLGPSAQSIIERSNLGIVGLGGGGSHLNQQLAHIGFQRVVLCDSDKIERTNLNRLVGGTLADVRCHRFKTKIASRVFKKLQPYASIDDEPKRWEDKREALRRCDVIFGAVDGFAARRDLEAFCRAHMIPFIDIGMKVHRAEGMTADIVGQTILSMPGEFCMHCIQFLTPEILEKEAEGYGNVGPMPQVVWSNGILASTAIGYAIGLLTGWSGSAPPICRVDYRESQHTVVPSRLVAAMARRPCQHYPLAQMGDPLFRKL